MEPGEFNVAQNLEIPEEVPVGFEKAISAPAGAAPTGGAGVKPLLPQDGQRTGGTAVMKRLKAKIDAAGKGPAGSGRDAAEEAPAGEAAQAVPVHVQSGGRELQDIPADLAGQVLL